MGFNRPEPGIAVLSGVMTGTTTGQTVELFPLESKGGFMPPPPHPRHPGSTLPPLSPIRHPLQGQRGTAKKSESVRDLYLASQKQKAPHGKTK